MRAPQLMRLLVVILYMAVPRVAAAGEFEIGGFGGFHSIAEGSELGRDDDSATIRIDDAALVGARIGYTFAGLIALEGEMAVMPTATNDDTELLLVAWRANALLQVDLGRITPFALVGAGSLSAFSDHTDVIREETDPYIHGGLGAKVELGASWGARFDGRVLFQPRAREPGDTTEFELLIGLYKQFGKPTPRRSE